MIDEKLYSLVTELQLFLSKMINVSIRLSKLEYICHKTLMNYVSQKDMVIGQKISLCHQKFLFTFDC